MADLQRTRIRLAFAGMLLVATVGESSRAQGPTIGGENSAAGSSRSSLGPIPGAGASQFINPGAGDQVLGGRPGSSVPRVPTSISTPSGNQVPTGIPSIAPPSDLQPATLPVFGTLAVPRLADDEGPPDGLTLDVALERLVRENLDLRGKSLEIPQAEADILTAGLRANPIFYADSQLVPYGQYSAARPGGQTQYDVNISYPLDLTRKRQARTLTATRQKAVLMAQYQDAVRLQIDNLYTSFVDILQARGAVRFSETGVQGLRDVYKSTDALFRKGEKTKADVNRIKIQLDTAEVALLSNGEALRRAKRTFGVLLAMSPDEAEALEIRGTIRDSSPPPPTDPDLIRIALTQRPDLNSYRLGVNLAEANVRLAKANVLPDVYVLYQPYTFQDNTFQGLKSATSWALGVTVPVPVYNRNQGNIQRAKLNVTQSQIQLAGIEKGIITEIRQAEQAYAVTLAAVRKIEESVLPDAQEVLDDSKRLFDQGELDVLGYLNARRDYNDVARQYLESLVAHRRSMLSLNSSLGQRILP